MRQPCRSGLSGRGIRPGDSGGRIRAADPARAGRAEHAIAAQTQRRIAQTVRRTAIGRVRSPSGLNLRPCGACLRKDRFSHGPFQSEERRAALRGCAAECHCRGGRHPRLCLFARDAGTACRCVQGRRCASGRRACRLCSEGQSQSGGAERAGGARMRRRCRLRRRDGARAGGGGRACRHRLFRRRQDEARDGGGARCRDRPVQYRERGRGRGAVGNRGGAGRAGGVHVAHQPRCRCADPCQNLDRQVGEQVRRADQRCGGDLRAAGGAAGAASARGGAAYR